MTAPLIVLNCVGLTPRLLQHAPRLSALAKTGWVADMPEVLPAVTCTAQATLLTGMLPRDHGIVANGWLFRDTQEVRFWQQSNKLIQAEPVYETARKRAAERGRKFQSSKFFWWFNQGADVYYSVTPKPWYGVDGNKAFDVSGTPDISLLRDDYLKRFGPFPFSQFWGPMAGHKSTEWIANTSSLFLRHLTTEMTLIYLPHLDYEPQQHGPAKCDMKKLVRELDDACESILKVAELFGMKVWVVSEYGHCDVTKPIFLNRTLRELNFLNVRNGPFGEQIDIIDSLAFAVCDHQIAHVYVNQAYGASVQQVRDILASLPGVDRVFIGDQRQEIGLDHPRSGEIILLAKPDAWFAYPFWLDDRYAPDYARAVAIHHKPGFDPCELFFDPKLRFPKLHMARRLIQKKLGFRTIFDVVPLDPSIVRGSHGLAAADPLDRPILIGHGPCPGPSVPMTAVRDLWLAAMDLA